MASVEAAHPHVTYADLERWPDDGKQYELYDGEVRVVPAPSNLHQIVLVNLLDILQEYRKTRGGFVLPAPLDIVFQEDTVLQPDITFLSAQTARLLDMHKPIRFAPDLVIEILSPSTSNWDRTRKHRIYARCGVAEYWIIDPDHETVEILELKDGDYMLAASGWRTGKLRSATLPGLVINLKDVFSSPFARERPTPSRP
ncbi:MAG: Uma2 family endonuclease [Acidobacteria bacterium]|nr:Uma2 family endonuclease [Acidobacteriota bacterium]